MMKLSAVLLLGVSFLAAGPLRAGQAAARPAAKPVGGLTAEDVIKLAKAGLSEDIIIRQIKKNGRAFDLSTDQLLALKAANVSDRVVEVMLDPAKAEVAASPAPSAPAPSAPTAPAIVAAKPEPGRAKHSSLQSAKHAQEPAELPHEVGVYARTRDQWEEVPPEIVYWKTGGVLKTIATAGIRHGDVNGHVQGAGSHSVFASPLRLLIVAPEGVALAEYQLLHLHSNKDNREFRTMTGGFLHAESGSQRDQVSFDGKKIESRVFEVTVPETAEPGEYGILPPGSNSGSGKIYSFRLKE